MIKNIRTLFVEFEKNIFQKFWLEDIFNSPEMEKISVSQDDTLNQTPLVIRSNDP